MTKTQKNMNIQAVLFDLDGTLADTALDLGAALNRLLRRHGLPEKDIAEIRPVASHGASGLIRLGAGIDLHHPDHAAWRRDFLAEYERGFTDKTVLFDGVNALIRGLRQRHLLWGIITNKPHAFTDRLVPRLGFAVPPDVVVSGDTTAEPKPSIRPMLYACARLNVGAQACVYVGDAERDMQAGKNAGMHTLLANWGYIAATDDTASWTADAVVPNPLSILDWLPPVA